MSTNVEEIDDIQDMFVDDTISGGFEVLPIETNWLRWRRGNPQFDMLAAVDPGFYYGGWSASVTAMKEPHDPLPEVPFQIVERKSSDGKAKFKRYASNILYFQFILARMRYELWDKKFVNADGSKGKLLSISQEKQEGFQPMKQVFGMALTKDLTQAFPVVLKLDNWSAFISFNKAEQAWAKIKPTPGNVAVRVFGTLGEKQSDGSVTPKIITYGESNSTPIEALYTSEPRFIPVTKEIKEFWHEAKKWKECELWNAEKDVADAPQIDEKALAVFQNKAIEIGLTDLEADEILSQCGNDPVKALAAIDTDGGPQTA